MLFFSGTFFPTRTFQDYLRWNQHIVCLSFSSDKKIGGQFRARESFSFIDLNTVYISHIRQSLEYFSHIWGKATPTRLNLLDSIQRRTVWLINDRVLYQTSLLISQVCSWRQIPVLQISPLMRSVVYRISRLGIWCRLMVIALDLLLLSPLLRHHTTLYLHYTTLHDKGIILLRYFCNVLCTFFKAIMYSQFA